MWGVAKEHTRHAAALLLCVLTLRYTVLQVESLMEGPRLQYKLDNERATIQSLSVM